MKKQQFAARIILNFLALLITDRLFNGIHIDGYLTLLSVAVLLAVFNQFVKPFLVLITIPVTILSLGLFLLVINALILYFTASLIDGFAISSFAVAFWGALTLSILNSLLGNLFEK